MINALKVMVVDDDTTALVLLKARLESAGCMVSTRDRSLGTSAAVIREKPDVVLLDVNMPGLQGDELAGLIIGRGIPVILHSGQDKETLESHMKRVGALGYIEKSGDTDVFLREFQRLVRELVPIPSESGTL